MFGIAVLVVLFVAALLAPAVLARLPMTRAGQSMVTGRPFDPFDPRRMR
jgi:hypothetical protein